ncbi:MAG: hypothetical protein JO099_13550, partial [Acidobacteriia bacterium]|nr:hypothetical protein [Terriglobia bacterium]
MARKINSEKDKTAGAAPVRTRRNIPTGPPKRSTKTPETPVSSIEDFGTETGLAVSGTGDPLGVSETGTVVAVSDAPSREEIARLAYHYWLDRGGQHGA